MCGFSCFVTSSKIVKANYGSQRLQNKIKHHISNCIEILLYCRIRSENISSNRILKPSEVGVMTLPPIWTKMTIKICKFLTVYNHVYMMCGLWFFNLDKCVASKTFFGQTLARHLQHRFYKPCCTRKYSKTCL